MKPVPHIICRFILGIFFWFCLFVCFLYKCSLHPADGSQSVLRVDLILLHFLGEDLRDSAVNNQEAYKLLIFKRDFFSSESNLIKREENPPSQKSPSKSPKTPVHKNVLY